MTCPEVTYLPLKAPDFFSASPTLPDLLSWCLWRGLYILGQLSCTDQGCWSQLEPTTMRRAFQEEGTVHTKYLEGRPFIKRTRSVRCVLGLYNVEDEHRGWRGRSGN